MGRAQQQTRVDSRSQRPNPWISSSKGYARFSNEMCLMTLNKAYIIKKVKKELSQKAEFGRGKHYHLNGILGSDIHTLTQGEMGLCKHQNCSSSWPNVFYQDLRNSRLLLFQQVRLSDLQGIH
ncbi:hypothetical protein MDA_GLEAN10014796 [Myotis davidii]|uniref:Uncharacterized protein n=1 Tax=Myotis davidii TaxID=225400 RepID=L5LP12_MYODS|nr:hypothetical protein MDA_GLEAN10014796 [Myotis davidii]